MAWMPVIIMAVFASLAVNALPITNNSDILESLSEGRINENTTHVMSADDKIVLFEGDIEISINEIRKYYDLNETSLNELRSESDDLGYHSDWIVLQAADSDEALRWPDRKIPFKISNQFSFGEKLVILLAQFDFALLTCVNFVERTTEPDYISYVPSPTSCSSHVGRVGCGKQEIKLARGCVSQPGIVMHEISHALGLWHEQSRPDRDDYIIIHNNNIQNGKDGNFLKRDSIRVDYQGTDYDYESLMHYGSTAFANCKGCETITVRPGHGNPVIGQRDGPSQTDILQIQRMYNCPQLNGPLGVFVIYISHGVHLGNGNSNIYMRINAIDSKGKDFNNITSIKMGTQSPEWYETFNFGLNHWQYFRLGIRNDITDELMYMQQTFPLPTMPTSQNNIKYCTEKCPSDYVQYSYWLLPFTFELLPGTLRVWILDAHVNTQNNIQDLYVIVTAITGGQLQDGNHIIPDTKQTPNTRDPDTRDPAWNELMDIGFNFYHGFHVQVFDGKNGRVSNPVMVEVYSGYYTKTKQCFDQMCDEYINLSYDYFWDHIDVHDDCLNGGHKSGHTCNCPLEYTGNRCEFLSNGITIFLRYGRNMRTYISFINDFYFQITAHDDARNASKYSSFIKIDENSITTTWNEYMYFDYNIHNWTRFEVMAMESIVPISKAYHYQIPSGMAGLKKDNLIKMKNNDAYAVFDFAINP